MEGTSSDEAALTILICSIFHVLIRCIKCINNKQMHFNFIDVLSL